MATCIITGAGSGIGKATATMMAEQKMYDSYALLGRSDNDLQLTKSDMQRLHPEATINLYHVDLAFPEQIPEVVTRVNTELGNITALFNIAGYTDPQPLLTTSIDSFDLTYKVNVFAPFVLMRECVKYMRRHGGKIMNVASTAGMTPRPGWLSYASSKAAVISMSETLTAELSEYGIMVYCVSPGRCATKLRRRLAPDEDPTTIMQPAEVAEVICNLMNTEECCLDGQNIIIRKSIRK